MSGKHNDGVRGSERSDADDHGRGNERRKVSPKARSRTSIAARHDSPEAYGRYAVDAAVDLFDGEPLEIFREVGRLDANHQRKMEHRLRCEQFAYLQSRVGPMRIAQ